MSGDLLPIIVAAFDRCSLALIMALLLASLWMAPSVTDTLRHRSVIFVCLLLLSALCALLGLLLRTASLADVPLGQAWGFVPQVLQRSDYGDFWLSRASAWLLMLGLALWSLWRGGSVLASQLLLLAILVTALLISVTGHAGEAGLWSVPNLINWLHLVGISLWGGPVILYATLILPRLRRSGWDEQTAQVAARLSTIATIALALVLTSGIYNSWHQLGSVAALWTTDYGFILLGKLVLVALMMAIGATNRFLLVPGVVRQEHGAAQRLLQVLRIDSLLFIAILVIAVVLGMQMPPVHAQ